MSYQNAISVYESYFNTGEVMKVSVLDFCKNVIGNVDGGDYRKEVDSIRKEVEKAKRNRLKSELVAVTISGTFSERNKKGLIQHSGFICIDIDAQDNPHVTSWHKERTKLGSIRNVFFSALSVSEHGVFLIVPISNTAKHEQHFDALQRAFKQMGYTIDKQCRDVSRLRVMSFDPGAVFNLDAIPYNLLYKPKPQKLKYKPQVNMENDALDKVLNDVIASGADITNDYEDWFEVGRAIVNEYGEAGRGLFHRLSQASPKYKESVCDKQFNACLRSPGKAGAGTLFHLAKVNGILYKN